jgi:N-acetylglucosaminyldiphosphoundecaprenol N-acetyl-beta-D-mannosaminyltransferase
MENMGCILQAGEASLKTEGRTVAQICQGEPLSTMESVKRRVVSGQAALFARIVERTAESAVALTVILAAVIPVSFVLGVRRLFTGKKVFREKSIRGVRGQRIRVLRFNVGSSAFIADTPLFLELLKGRIALVGTEISDTDERDVADPGQALIDEVRPGLVSLWGVRRYSRIAHEGKQAIELEYVSRKGLLYDFLLLLRYVPVMLYRENGSGRSSVMRLLGLDVTGFTMSEAVTVMENNLRLGRKSSIFFVNPDCCNKMVTDREYFRVLKQADYVFPDGIGLVIAGKILGTPVRENVNGTDMFPYLCKMARDSGHSIFLLGGRPGVAEKAAMRTGDAYGVTVAGTAHGYFDHETESEALIREINDSGAGILLVAFGAPLQEKWIARHRDRLRPPLVLGVGGLFDFYSGRISRAPVWIREIGFEWVFRILMEPGRMWKRYVVGNPLFLFRVMKWKLFSER